jgi:hypothetical protein
VRGISCSRVEWNLFCSAVYCLIFCVRFGIPWKVSAKVNSYCTSCVEQMIGWIRSRVQIAQEESAPNYVFRIPDTPEQSLM